MNLAAVERVIEEFDRMLAQRQGEWQVVPLANSV